jgi:nucleotidyltransferase/DNA polymerase involved in DNA repair
MSIVRRFIPIVEQASIDEAYGDLSFTESYKGAEGLCRRLKEAIRSEEQLTASIGIGPNKLIAKIASGMHKPDGLTVVREDEAESFLAPLSVRAIPGIGPKTEAMLMKKGIRLVRDLKSYDLSQLDELLGKRGVDLYDKIRGRDASPVEEFSEPKSIGEQETFNSDTRESRALVGQLEVLAKDVIDRLRLEGFKSFRTVVLTVRFADFETKSRAHTLVRSASDAGTLQREALKLLLPFLDHRENPRRKLFRLLGLRVEKLE